MITLGITMNFAPVVDVNSNPANPIIGIRSFGSSPADVARLGMAHIAPYRESGVVCVAKHFPGHGDTDIDSHIGLPIVKHDRARLEAVELYPFRAGRAAHRPHNAAGMAAGGTAGTLRQRLGNDRFLGEDRGRC